MPPSTGNRWSRWHGADIQPAAAPGLECGPDLRDDVAPILIHMRTMEGLAAARSRGRIGGRKQKLNAAQVKELLRMVAAKDRTMAEVGEVFGISREAVYGYIHRAKAV